MFSIRSIVLLPMRRQMRYALEIAISFTPWLMSMYLLYWLEYSKTWTSQAAHHGKIFVAILAVGMGLSFLVQSYFAKRKQK